MNTTQKTMNGTGSSIGYSLSVAPYQLNIWVGSFLWIVGNIGCLGNMMVFRSRTLRKRAYSIYLFASAVADFHYFNFVLMTRILQKGFQIPLINRYEVICKLRQFSTVWGNVVGFTLFAFATIDRLLSTQRSNTYRRWSNRVSLAYKMVFVIPFFWFMLFGHRIVLYRITNGQCLPPSGFYSYFDNYFQVVFSSLSPAVVMSILAYLLIKSIRRVSRRRVAPALDIVPVVNSSKKIIHQMDFELTRMLTLESLIAIVTYVPYASQLTYANITQDWPKTSLRLAWEKVLTELIHLMSYVFFATSFYVSILSNIGFRRKIKRILQRKRPRPSQDRIATALRVFSIVN